MSNMNLNSYCSNKNRLDINFIRSNFPAFSHPIANSWIFFDNASGSYVTKQVLDRFNHYMTATRVGQYQQYTPSVLAGEEVNNSYKLFAQMINAEHEEVIFNSSTSLNFYTLANSFKHWLKPGDEVIVTNQDHESNIGFWRRLADFDSGVVIKEWQVSKESGLLTVNNLKELLSYKTKLVCFTHCSNVIGEIHDVKTIVKLIHNYGGLVVIDGVSFAPHGLIDVKDLDVDFYSYSLYKTFGPHLALLYAKKEHLAYLHNEGHHFNDQINSKKLSPAGAQYTEIASARGIIDYYLVVYNHHFTNDTLSLREKIAKVFGLFYSQEVLLCTPLLEYLKNNKKIRLLGNHVMTLNKRSSNISFLCKERTSNEIVTELTKNKIASSHYHFYAKRLMKAIGVENADDGVVRLSLLHYNTISEVYQTIKILDTIL